MQDVRKNTQKERSLIRKQKMSADPIARLKRSFQTRIYALLKGHSKSSKLLSKYLGCTFDVYLEWIKYQLSPGMTMDNYGQIWHVDHVRPCASFDFTKEDHILQCMNWQNMRPCLKHENLCKSSKICEYTIAMHERLVNMYLQTKLTLM